MDKNQEHVDLARELSESQSVAGTLGTAAQEETVCFDTIYTTYAPLLRKIAMRKFHIPRADVDTIVHDVFATYLAQQERVREVHPYLIGGICNAAREYWRKVDRERAVFCDGDVCAAMTDDRLLESLTQNLLAQSALSTLGPSCRETLRRFYVDGESASSIAASRDTTDNAIFRLLHYCRARARDAYRALAEGKEARGPSK
jgi:DNA-directed RNA polymerase specialized sigma24 family protein